MSSAAAVSAHVIGTFHLEWEYQYSNIKCT